MSGAERPFFDTNVLLYLISCDTAKADKAEALLAKGGVVSVQVLNEFVSVAGRKQKLLLPEIRDVLSAVRTLCNVVPVCLDTHDVALDLIERFKFSIYDALVLAAAQQAGCTLLYSEDMQHGQKIEQMTICNPFREI